MRNPETPELAVEFARSLAAIRPDIAQAVARVIFQSDHRALVAAPECADSDYTVERRHCCAA
ncbi:MAG: hypothetical protein MUC60_12535 [Oscillatoria sp. Prado101]|jgi:hypothetical protein|nr:hypothetical protein [Oscillatoria sp. Prado101]